MKIVLCCAGGLSTTMLMDSIKDAIKRSPKLNEDDFELEAIAVDTLENAAPSADAVVLGPQIAHKRASVEKVLEGKQIPVIQVDSVTYGKMDGATVLKKILVEQIKLQRAKEA
jgi:PTS system cellobiose-specific IIB component